jgi:hypothetical protein
MAEWVPVTEEAYDDNFWIEVNRVAHELGIAHGWSAASYATKQAESALTEGKSEEHRFWAAVAASLTRR